MDADGGRHTSANREAVRGYPDMPLIVAEAGSSLVVNGR
jgi:hypothetical protein